ncbi:5-carboxymethyl-2-hydroxymuconate Delta-isomerase [Xylophilus sp.]|uniref:5-carboxymethyl-2-hydroxymuconate Delta-isomerase n=1 Tax=Xylophilus sp. TaxID=2653893 RepID=UPI0013B86235|nr:5-carboxymethyl-2-hydroxymuconate Delta-isomerase [Xylophilus sp.]KAF1044781.1 MAG: hypothetical protein GAK38_03381 [Xylophilus sp.]
MPHLIVEYTPNLAGFAADDILAALNDTLIASGEIANETDLKARAVPVETFRIGNQPAQRAFVHAQLRLLAGRTPEAKRALSDRIAAVLRERVPRPTGVLVQLSAEIVDMDRDAYSKEKLPAA